MPDRVKLRRTRAPLWALIIFDGVGYALIAVFVTHTIRPHKNQGVLIPALIEGALFGLVMGAYYWWRQRHPVDH